MCRQDQQRELNAQAECIEPLKARRLMTEPLARVLVGGDPPSAIARATVAYFGSHGR